MSRYKELVEIFFSDVYGRGYGEAEAEHNLKIKNRLNVEINRSENMEYRRSTACLQDFKTYNGTENEKRNTIIV